MIAVSCFRMLLELSLQVGRHAKKWEREPGQLVSQESDQPSSGFTRLPGQRRDDWQLRSGELSYRLGFLGDTRKTGAVSSGHRKGCGSLMVARIRALCAPEPLS
jgi:hypothetical protein